MFISSNWLLVIVNRCSKLWNLIEIYKVEGLRMFNLVIFLLDVNRSLAKFETKWPRNKIYDGSNVFQII